MTLQREQGSMLRHVRWALPVLAASSLLLAACGSSGVKGTGGSVPLAGSHTNLAASWVSIQDGSSASLITWTINGHSTSGNITGSSGLLLFEVTSKL